MFLTLNNRKWNIHLPGVIFWSFDSFFSSSISIRLRVILRLMQFHEITQELILLSSVPRLMNGFDRKNGVNFPRHFPRASNSFVNKEKKNIETWKQKRSGCCSPQNISKKKKCPSLLFIKQKETKLLEIIYW